jgi:hypothetical protein
MISSEIVEHAESERRTADFGTELCFSRSFCALFAGMGNRRGSSPFLP